MGHRRAPRPRSPWFLSPLALVLGLGAAAPAVTPPPAASEGTAACVGAVEPCGIEAGECLRAAGTRGRERCLERLRACRAAGKAPCGTEAVTAGYIQGYVDPHSYVPGETVTFYASTDAATFTLDIYRDGWNPQTLVARIADLPGVHQPVPEDGWLGARWAPSATWTIPPDLQTGQYLVRFTPAVGTPIHHPFVVRQGVPGTRVSPLLGRPSRILAIHPFATVNAYNDWPGSGLLDPVSGEIRYGKSLYVSWVPHDSGNARMVSLARPISEPAGGRGNGYAVKRDIAAWLELEGFAPEYATDEDLDRDPELLRHYDTVILMSHPAYISHRLRDALEAHFQRGGHLLGLGGNDIWWQVRYDDSRTLMTSYKLQAIPRSPGDKTYDPLYYENPMFLTTKWNDDLITGPFPHLRAAALKGTEYVEFCYQFECADLLVANASHWAFAGTGLQDGDPLGTCLAEGETDDIVAGASPPVLDVLTTALRNVPREGYHPPVSEATTSTVYYEDTAAYGWPGGNGGKVFAAGGTDFGRGLNCDYDPACATVRTFVRNLLLAMVNSPPPLRVGGSVDDLQVALDASGDVLLSWGPSCLASDDDFQVYEGKLGDWSSHYYRAISTGGELTFTLTPTGGDSYYVVVPSRNGVAGSNGPSSSAASRPPGAAFYRFPSVGACPPP